MNLINGVVRFGLMPISRLYARHFVKDQPADRVLQFLAGLFFFRMHGYWPRLRCPRSFEEKVNARMLFDRNPLWTKFSDKYAVREYVRDRVGEEHLIPLLWSGTDVEAIPFTDLPAQFVLKTNHGCGYNIIVNDKARLDLAQAKRQLARWMNTNFGADEWNGTQWAYRNIPRRILVEEFIGEDGHVPLDFKVFCFGGRPEYFQVNFDRFGEPCEKIFDRDFRPLDLFQGIRQYALPFPPPASQIGRAHV